MPDHILIVDDEQDVVEFCSKVLRQAKYETRTANSGEAALELLAAEHFDLMITDIMMPGMTGLDLLNQAHETYPNLAAVVMTGYGTTIEIAIKALRVGARDFIPKPFGMADLRESTEHALAQAKVMQEHATLRALLPFLELSNRAYQNGDPDAFVSQALELAMAEVHADGGAYYANVDSSAALSIELARGVLPDPLPSGEIIGGLIGEEAHACILTAAEPGAECLADGLKRVGISTVLLVPMRTLNQPTGVLAFTRTTGRPTFRQSDVDSLTVLASHTAALLQNLRMMDKLEVYNSTLEEHVQQVTAKLVAAQEKLLLNERLATIGKLGASVAHELRNPLGVINNSTYYLQSRLGVSDPKISKHLNIISHEVEVSNRIITDLMQFVRVREVTTKPNPPNDMVRDALERSLLPDNVSVRTSFGSDLPMISVDSEKIEQVFINLMNNAAQAMPDGGDLTIRTLAQEDQVLFEFTDTGCGIPPEHLEPIFEPLFTTKAKGIGLGLAIVKLLIDAHGGKITVRSQVGKGSQFTVSLPTHTSNGQRPG
ncbi:MAG: sensor histidine kinase [Anaerolineae bacterium]